MEKNRTGNKRIWSRIIALVLALILVINTVISMQAHVLFSTAEFSGTTAEHAADVTASQTDYLSKNRFGRAMTVLRTMLHKPKTSSEYEEYASIAIAREKYDEAADYLQGAIDTFEGSDEDLAVLYLRLGSAYMLLENQEKALTNLNKAVSTDPDLTTAYLLRADIYQAKGEAGKAADDLKMYYTAEPGDPATLNSLAQLYEDEHDYKNAIDCYTLGIRDSNDEMPELYAKRARLEIMTEDYTSAETDLDQYFKLTEADPNGQYTAMLAMCRMNSGKNKEALDLFHKAVENGYETPQLLYSQAAICAYAEKKYDVAIEDGLKAIEAYEAAGEQTPSTCYWVGMSYLAKKDYEKAVSYLEKTAEQDDTIKDIQYYLGVCAMAREQDDEAISYFTASINKKESMTACLYDRGICYLRNAKYEEARADLEQVVEKNDDKELTKQAKELIDALNEAN